ncbi:MAG: beta-ketoacyl-ACP synthase II [Candidatus Omnitrophica bacterium]|nr:beta-ketoacyl-ACP synthase II [Candidatus Omnitrophota bacterium]
MSERRVVITGLGIVAPNTVGKENFWAALIEGKSGIRRITRFDPTPFPTKIAGEVDLDISQFIEHKKARRMDRTTHLAMAAAKLAFTDSRLDLASCNTERIGVILATTMAGKGFTLEEYENAYRTKGPMKINTFTAIASFPDAAASCISLEFGLQGPSFSLSTACSSSSDALSSARDLIQKDTVDSVIVGGSDAPLFAPVFSSFCVLRALSKRNDTPQAASRPFDRLRDGFVLSEGAGVLILEELEFALKRGAHIYGEILGVSSTCDAYHITSPDPQGQQAERALRLAISDARIKPQDIDYINAHGTSTPLNDKIETMVIKRVFGERAKEIPVSSTKSMIGHTIAAAGALEICAAMLALEKGIIHPTINQEVPDPDCDLNYVPNKAITTHPKIILKNSFGFGGKNAALVIGKI